MPGPGDESGGGEKWKYRAGKVKVRDNLWVGKMEVCCWAQEKYKIVLIPDKSESVEKKIESMEASRSCWICECGQGQV